MFHAGEMSVTKDWCRYKKMEIRASGFNESYIIAEAFFTIRVTHLKMV